MEDILERDLPETVRLLTEMETNSRASGESVKSLICQVKEKALLTSKGISFLEVKNLTLLSYLIDLTYLMVEKCSGKKMEGNRGVDRLVETRTVIEKMRPIHHKLKYQMDKLVKAANTGTVDANDPLRLRPKPENLVGDDMEEEEEEGSEAGDGLSAAEGDKEMAGKGMKSKKPKMYVAPKVAAVRYEDETGDEKKVRALERAKKRALSSSVMQELRGEFDEGPEEIVETSVGRRKQKDQIRQRREYEEDYMVRLSVPKKQKSQESGRGLLTMTSLSGDITRFENVSVLDVNNAEDMVPDKRKKGGGAKNKGKKGKGKKKLRKFKKK